ncbi:hypothetical protein 3S15_5 [uncultured Caudovirales phage]|uniref:Uncharacterized protein n=1 Tax=uncultured Caudovirales phage TaxID=2100421 RepID=A0A2H4JC52_9CAUD|nr:hypothetical protein 3S15_5 [uncultured Caudovirales phage]
MKKIVIGGGVALAILVALMMDLRGKETVGLANAHRAAGFDPSCETVKAEGSTWAVCKYGGTPSAWLQAGDDWATANGRAQQVMQRLEEKGPGPYQYLPRLYVARGMPSMPAAVLERLK